MLGSTTGQNSIALFHPIVVVVATVNYELFVLDHKRPIKEVENTNKVISIHVNASKQARYHLKQQYFEVDAYNNLLVEP